MNKGGSGDELWDEFVREFEKNNATHEPAAAERAQQQVQPPPEGRRSRRRVLVPLTVALLVAAGAGAYALDSTRSEPAAAPAVPAPSASPSLSPSASPSAPASASASASALGGSLPFDDPTAALPLSVFPAQVEGYTLVKKTTSPVCTGAETVSPMLAGVIVQGSGCLGVDQALYKDADGNQYNLVLFTMKDPAEAVDLMMTLARNAENPQVVGLVPPADSGLRHLPEGSGTVQHFLGLSQHLMIGTAQWSDGRTEDFNVLVDKLSPLADSVARNFPGWVDPPQSGQSGQPGQSSGTA
ncbi:hypothetical protein ACFV6F_37710 [Kitasatospora phosalacinea]|uniref:hypothetical protein n=1 Tax=Kitasatospora phosalacinea TaxID=2065 RepID=UPI003659904C